MLVLKFVSVNQNAMDLTYPIILLVVLILGPLILTLANKQDSRTKRNLKIGFFILLLLELTSGFFNWESFSGTGQSGFALTLDYPSSLLGLFFAIVLIQMILLFIPKRTAHLAAVVLNFINTAVFFVGVISVSGLIGKQVVSLWSIGVIFAVLIGNVVGLVWINKDNTLTKN